MKEYGRKIKQMTNEKKMHYHIKLEFSHGSNFPMGHPLISIGCRHIEEETIEQFSMAVI